MELNYRTANGRMTFRLTAETPKEIFQQIAGVQETFEAETACGVCGGEDIKFQRRLAGDKDQYDYFELVCKNVECRARFSFGQSLDKKNLFPKRTDDEKEKGDDGYYLPNRGWVKYVKPAAHEPARRSY